jgi:hypothetical protein
MVDRLRSAIDGLEPPVCSKCHDVMRWWKSELVPARSDAKETVVHSFYCGTCGRTAKTEIESRHQDTLPPTKLSRPFRRFFEAA